MSQKNVDKWKSIKAASLNTIMDSIAQGVVIVDTSLRVFYFNKFAEHLTGYKHTDVVNTMIDDAIPLRCDKDSNLGWPLQSVVDTGNEERRDCDFITIASGRKMPVVFHAAGIVGENGKQLGIMVIFRDVTEEKELMRLKSEFVSIVSHQLRTPASAVKWYLETLIDNRRGNKMNKWQSDKLHESYQSNERMIHLINDLLNVSRLDSGRYELNKTDFHLHQLMEEIISELTHFAHAHNVTIDNAIHKDIPEVSADRNKIREVILNLVTNAIKYTRKGHHQVEVGAKVEGSILHFFVRDGGIGIPKKDMEHIFKKFYRADNAIESQTEGSGLGLYIAREIVRLHGGDMWLESEENIGTTVHVTLPIKQA